MNSLLTLPTFPGVFTPWFERQPEPPWLQPLLPALLISSLLLPHQYRLAALPLLLGFASLIPRYKSSADSAMDTYALAFFAANSIWHWLDLVVAGAPEKRFWWKEDAARVAGEQTQPEVAGLSPTEIEEKKRRGVSWLFWKFRWAASLVLASRGAGWNWQVKGVAKGVPPGYSRWRFVGINLIKSAYCFFLGDMAGVILRMIMVKVLPTNDPQQVFKLPLQWQLLGVWASAFQTTYLLKFIYNLAATVSVALYISPPQAWPPLMDSFREHMYTVRKTWGTAYHQLLRRNTSAPAIWLCRRLGLPRGSWPSRYLQLFAGFFLSALLHHIGGLNTGLPVVTIQIWTFTIQPLGIMFEDAVVAVAGRFGWKESRLTRCIGCVWAIAWFSFSLRYMFAGQVSVGFLRPRQPMTVLQPLIEQYLQTY